MPSWKPSFNRADVSIEQVERAFDGFFKVDRLTLTHPRFEKGEIKVVRELFKRGDAVCLVLYDPVKDRVVLIEQFRVGALAGPSPWVLELVAGIVEPGESAAQVAIREADEEAGVKVSNLRSIIRFMPSGGGCDEWIELMYAEVDSDLASGIHGLEAENEDIKVHVMSSEDAFKLVRQGVVNSSPAIIGLQWLELNRDRLVS